MSEKFYGGLISTTGETKDKIFLFEKDEKVLIGTNVNSDIVIKGEKDEAIFCSILFDLVHEEYQVCPQDTNTVFLDSGQPLGENRIYCIPRGRAIWIENRFNEYILA